MQVYRNLSAALSGVLMLLLAGCQTIQTTQPGAVGVTRTQSIMGDHAQGTREMDQESALV